MGGVTVVTDSTAYLPPELSEGVLVVPLRVAMGQRSGLDRIEVSVDDVSQALLAKQLVTTSRPTPTEFAATYERALAAGADHIVSMHISAALSGTWESAVLAAQDFGYGTVRVLDSRSTGAALGFAVVAAAAVARAGGTAAQVQDAAVSTIDRTRTHFYVDTLEYLRRGGRVGAAAALLATSLSVKPLLHMLDGQIMPMEKVRTSAKAIARLVALTEAATGGRPADIAVQHVSAPDRAEAVVAQLRAELPQLRELYVADAGAVISAHLGPGGLGTVVLKHPNSGELPT
jgi:DegV family protein with EDD domain